MHRLLRAVCLLAVVLAAPAVPALAAAPGRAFGRIVLRAALLAALVPPLPATAAAPSAAPIYRCSEHRRVTYQDVPCSPAAKQTILAPISQLLQAADPPRTEAAAAAGAAALPPAVSGTAPDATRPSRGFEHLAAWPAQPPTVLGTTLGLFAMMLGSLLVAATLALPRFPR